MNWENSQRIESKWVVRRFLHQNHQYNLIGTTTRNHINHAIINSIQSKMQKDGIWMVYNSLEASQSHALNVIN